MWDCDLRAAGYTELGGINWTISLRIVLASCPPAERANVYDRSKPFGPSTRISQFSLARDPAMDTRHSPRLSLNACSMLAAISFDSWASPRFCSSIVTPIALHFIELQLPIRLCKPVKAMRDSFASES